MNQSKLPQYARESLYKLCADPTSRRVGSRGNHNASRYIREQLEQSGARVETQRFNCLDHRSGDIHLSAGGENFEVFISPYSNPCDLEAPLALAETIADLQKGNFGGKILLLSGDLTTEQLMPKNYPFYYPDTHREIHHLLESQQPAAIITATSQNSELAGAPYPFPMIEDGNFDIPSAYMTDIEGNRLSNFADQSIRLIMDAERIPSWAENVSATFGPISQPRLVVCAHLDAKQGSPGAVDNAGGIVVLLLLAELLEKTPQCPAVEILAINGEDNYSAGGEMTYLKIHHGKLDQIRLVINVDGAAYHGYHNALSFYGTSPAFEETARNLLDEYPTIELGESWPQSDHMVFAMNQVPAMAITTCGFAEMEKEIAHTKKDVPELVDIDLLAETAQYICDILTQYEEKDSQ